VGRPLRLEFPGAVYHVTARGNNRQAIFLDTDDRGLFLDVLAEVVDRYSFRCHAYCLMGNHYHLLVETERANLSLGMRQLNGLYCRRFNRARGRSGHLFQARYRAILVEKERHLLALSRYVVRNPVRAGLCASPVDWPWSSCRAMLGLVRRPVFLTADWLLSQFARSRVRARHGYRSFVETASDEDPWRELVGGLYLGSEEFIATHAPDAELSTEIAFEQRVPIRPQLAEILTGGDARGIVTAYMHGYRLSEIAQMLGVHPSTVSRRLRAAELRLVRECKT
jgi:REP element-mobilizing transposase RayT